MHGRNIMFSSFVQVWREAILALVMFSVFDVKSYEIIYFILPYFNLQGKNVPYTRTHTMHILPTETSEYIHQVAALAPP